MQNLVILGSTGSIGESTLKVVEENPDVYQVYGLVAKSSWRKLLDQAIHFKAHKIVLIDDSCKNELTLAIKDSSWKPQVKFGLEAELELVQESAVDIVMSSVVGFAGLFPTIASISASKKVLLANKESLVVAGDICFKLAKDKSASIIPVDSEHNAMFQSLPVSVQNNLGFCDLSSAGVDHLILTGSGGPFKDLPLDEFSSITKEMALKHPNWSMGPKITIDSATMMNKGLEYIEACVLYNCNPDQIKVVIHPQSVIHSMVVYFDGSVIAELGTPDMTTPISYAMSHSSSDPTNPKRHYLNNKLDFTKVKELTFRELDFNRYPCFKLAIDAYHGGFYKTTVLNAANEVAVSEFLAGRIQFIQISQSIERCMYNMPLDIDKDLELFVSTEYDYLNDYFDLDSKVFTELKYRIALDLYTRSVVGDYLNE